MTETEDLYDLLGKDYLNSMYLNNIWTNYVDRNEKSAVVEIWDLNPGKNKDEAIVDLGMGPGRWSKFFISSGFKKVVGLDLSLQMVEAARKYVSNPKFEAVKGDMTSLPFVKNSFDKVFCFRAFKYVPNSEMAIREIKRVLKPKGTGVLEFSNKTLLNMVLKYISLAVVKLNPHIPIESRFRYFVKAKFYSKKEVFELINLNGLSVSSYRYFALLPSIPLASNFTWLWVKLDRVLFRILPKNLFSRSLIFLISK